MWVDRIIIFGFLVMVFFKVDLGLVSSVVEDVFIVGEFDE